VFRIGEFSKMSKTTVKTLRYYDEVGLLKPEEIDHFTGYRIYTTDQLVELHRIQELRQIGLSINEIIVILSGQDYEPILQKRKAELISELNEGRIQLSRIEFILQGDKNMNYSATIKELSGCIVYSKRITIPNYDAAKQEVYFEIIPKIGETISKQYPELKCANPEYCFITYPDGEHKEKDVVIEFCEAVDKFYPNFDDIIFKEVNPCTIVSIIHKGTYAQLAKAYAYACKWIDENGYIIADNPRENYIDGIWNKESESDWLTEIQVPVIRK